MVGWIPDDQFYAMKAEKKAEQSSGGKGKGGGKGNWIPDEEFYAKKAAKAEQSSGGKGKGGGRTGWIPDDEFYAMKAQQKGSGSSQSSWGGSSNTAGGKAGGKAGGGKSGWMPDEEFYAMKAQQKKGSSGGGKGNWMPDDVFYAMKAAQKASGGDKGVWKHHFQKQNSGKGWGKNRQKRTDPKKTAWVGGLAEGTTFEELMEIGKTSGAKWAELYTGKGQGTGALGFGSPQEAAEAIIMLNGVELNGVSITVDTWEKPKAVADVKAELEAE